MTSAYLFVTHGSRAPRPHIAAERLVCMVKQQILKSKTTNKDFSVFLD
ncbi:MAG: hypothetical protein ACP8RL_01485 [cyanobacterium endosymbiont of Rhopalodia inflata]